MLLLENISKFYKTKGKTIRAVDDISLAFHKGEFVSILGLSGSGKTTLVSQIGGLDKPSEGCMKLSDVDTSNYKAQEWADYRLNNIGFVFQDFNLINHLTAKENIEIALSLSGHSSKEKSERAEELLRMMGLSDRKDQLPTQLSGGEKQRIAIARALANEPEIILADEPTGALDPDTSVQIMNILQDLANKGHLVIMVTHNKYLAKDYSTRIVELKAGKIINEEILDNHSDFIHRDGPVKRSSLEIGAALKIAFNNLKLRKKSTLFSLVSLIPSMILIFALMNFIFNLSAYREDFEPVTKAVLNDSASLYISPYTDDQLNGQVKRVYKSIADRRYNEEALETFRDSLVAPYDQDFLKEVRGIPGVVEVVEPAYFNIVIDNNEFVLVTLPPKKYMDKQYAIKPEDYPEDDEEGLIMSTEAMKVLKGKYSNDLTSHVGESYEIEMWGVNGVGFAYGVYNDQEDIMVTEVLNIFDAKAKTTLIENYYSGYIFIPYNMGMTLKHSFETTDFTLIATSSKGPLSTSEDERIFHGPLSVMDLLKPLREKTMLQSNYDLFRFREFAYVMPSNNFGLKHLVIIDESFGDEGQNTLRSMTNVFDSPYDDETYASASRTDTYLRYTLLGSSLFAILIIAIPSLLVCVILYISILLRVKEIGILKSIGARNRDILGIFTIEAGIVALVGTLVGMIIALPGIKVVHDLLENHYRISYYLGSNPMAYNIMGLVLAGIGALILVTGFGLLPGRKASRLQPNVLLKHVN